MTQDKELEALTSIQETLQDVDEEARKRIVAYLVSRHGVSAGIPAKGLPEAGPGEQALEFPDLVSLYDAARPHTEPERALVVGYWYQEHEQQGDLGSQAINTALKNLGEGVSNITSAMSALSKRKPSLVRQVEKKGSSKQARKKYRLTRAGIQAVKRMVAGQGLDEE